MARDAAAERRVAVVLFNLGGPKGQDDVRGFLFNLFSDPAIIDAPNLVRYPVAALIAGLRARSAKRNYAKMGGGSPLLPQTIAQAERLEHALRDRLAQTRTRVFTAMRYAPPLTAETAEQVAAFEPDEIILLPLYPQFSTTTTASSLGAWTAAYVGPGQIRSVCCYPTLEAFVQAHAERIEAVWSNAGQPAPIRLLFSAHGLPLRVLKRGDPYQDQIQATAAAVATRLGAGWDWRVCYQSRVGPMKWLGPSTVEAIGEAGAAGVGVIVAPIAFVSEHVETLVELDHDYAIGARRAGCPVYLRAPALGVQDLFIDGLADLAVRVLQRDEGVAPGSAFVCGSRFSACPLRG